MIGATRVRPAAPWRLRRSGTPAFGGPLALGLCAVVTGAMYPLAAYTVHPLALPAAVIVAGLAVVTLSRPEVGVAAAFVLLSLNSGLIGGRPWLPGTAWTAFLFIASFTGKVRDRDTVSPLGLAVLAFGLLGIVGLIVSGDPAHATPLVRSVLTGLALYFVIATQIRVAEQAQWVVGGIVASAGLIGGFATVQYLRGSGSSVGFITETGELVSRVTGGFGQPNQLAGFLILIVGLALGGALVPRPGRTLYAVAAAVSVVGIYGSFSRGALLGLVVLPLVFLGGRRALLLAPLVALAVLVATPNLARERFGTLTQEGGEVADRVDFWRTAVSLWADHPVFGVGPGGFEDAYAEARVPGKRFLPDTAFQPPPHAHNLALNLLAEQGVVGFVSFAVVFWLAVREGLRVRRSSEQWARIMGSALVASLLAFAVHNQFDVTLGEGTGTFFWGVLGVVAAMRTVAPEERSPVPAG
jgi:putative inorganic carbon (hco3(-)) transporter